MKNILDEAFKVLNNTKKAKSLTEGAQAFGATYEDLCDEVFDALSPMEVDRLKDGTYRMPTLFDAPPYDDDQVFPDFKRHQKPGMFVYRVELKDGQTDARVIEVCKGFGIDYETDEYHPDWRFVLVPENGKVMKELIKESCNEDQKENSDIEAVNVENLPKDESLDAEVELEEGLFGYPMEEEDILEELNEDANLESPIQTLSPDQILSFVERIPKAVGGVTPPRKFKLGYVTDATNLISAKYKGGRGSINKETGEALPIVRLIKASEYSSVYVEPYTSAKATQAAFKAQGKTIDDVLPRKGFHVAPNGIRGIFESDYGKGLAFGPLMDSNCRTKVKYFISIDGGNFVEVPKSEVAQYTPNPAAFMTPKSYAPADPNQPQSQRTQTFYLNGIYLIGNLGNSEF